MENNQERIEILEEASQLPQEESQGQALPPEEPHAQKLAAHIRQQSAQSHVIPLKKIKFAPPDGVTAEEAAALLALVATAQADPALEKISFVQGKKDLYYFDTELMTRHFAELDSMLADKDILHTIATVTRSDSQLYPRPTQFSKLMTYPFYFTMDEIMGAIARMKLEEQYADIDVVTATNGGMGTFSTQFMSKRYAQSLIQQVEVEESENQ